VGLATYGMICTSGRSLVVVELALFVDSLDPIVVRSSNENNEQNPLPVCRYHHFNMPVVAGVQPKQSMVGIGEKINTIDSTRRACVHPPTFHPHPKPGFGGQSKTPCFKTTCLYPTIFWVGRPSCSIHLSTTLARVERAS
jgi:hypothetical protein